MNYAIGIYEKSMPDRLTLLEKLKATRQAGFDWMEISIDETEAKLNRLQWGKAERMELIQAIHETGTPVRTLCLSGHRKFPMGSLDPVIRNRAMDILRGALQFAGDIGIRLVQLAGYDEYYHQSDQETRKYFRENLLLSVKLAAQEGVILAFETMETEFMDTVEKAMVYVRLADSPYLKLYPDLGNLTNASHKYGVSVDHDLGLAAGHLVALHLKETKPGHYREVPFGTGHVDFTGGIKKAWDQGVRMYTAEFWSTGEDEWLKDLLATRKYFKEIFITAMGR
jgi:L-ribulose-5-phosphate 3-epimerase